MRVQLRARSTSGEASALVDLLPQPAPRANAPQRGVITLPEYSFEAQRAGFCFVTHLTCQEAVEVGRSLSVSLCMLLLDSTGCRVHVGPLSRGTRVIAN